MPLQTKEQKMSLQEAREAKGLTQAQLSEALGFTSPQFISNVERGLAQIPKRHFKKLAKLLGRQAVVGEIHRRLKRVENELYKHLGKE